MIRLDAPKGIRHMSPFPLARPHDICFYESKVSISFKPTGEGGLGRICSAMTLLKLSLAIKLKPIPALHMLEYRVFHNIDMKQWVYYVDLHTFQRKPLQRREDIRPLENSVELSAVLERKVNEQLEELEAFQVLDNIINREFTRQYHTD